MLPTRVASCEGFEMRISSEGYAVAMRAACEEGSAKEHLLHRAINQSRWPPPPTAAFSLDVCRVSSRRVCACERLKAVAKLGCWTAALGERSGFPKQGWVDGVWDSGVLGGVRCESGAKIRANSPHVNFWSPETKLSLSAEYWEQKNGTELNRRVMLKWSPDEKRESNERQQARRSSLHSHSICFQDVNRVVSEPRSCGRSGVGRRRVAAAAKRECARDLRS
ncbi:hypothetical protein LIA77_08318 [Sarocladium implicatum]|nr:hypothetical protein LIA77_08318 [Sarocladium implicatum]